MLALSIVAPNGSNIASGRKTLEVRSWRPARLPIRDLLIVENEVLLTNEGQIDQNGTAVALLDIEEIEDWKESEIEAACSRNWVPGYWAWRLVNVRPIVRTPVVAKRGLYEVELNAEFLNGVA